MNTIGFIFKHLIFIAVVIGLYVYITNKGYFYAYQDQIALGVKILIAFDIFIASLGSVIVPILTVLAGLALLYMGQDYTFYIGSIAWQLLILGGVGFVMKLFVR